ncbi:septum site-determining protein Ssd [Psychromicrobium lacuslunae]|uniref:septum site-determining protein Ssd n=1 Tax=Psychromicrobium lacuslunae TaxID=1618207 RepID=UPI0006986162|nr:septum site-determining protein Ssd [Psychromicrobium lacuslunae]
MPATTAAISPRKPPAPVQLLIATAELRAQVEAALAAAGADFVVGSLNAATISALVVDLQSLPQRSWRHDDTPTLLVGRDDEEAELWLAAASLGIDRVAPMPKAATWLVEFLSGLHAERSRGRMVTILGGCGGAGATTLSALLALQLNRLGRSSLLVDADPWGAGVESSLAPNPPDGLNWQGLAASSGSLNPSEFAEALPELASSPVLGFGNSAQPGGEAGIRVLQRSAAAVIDAARRGFDIVLTDPGRSRETQENFVLRADLLLCVLPANLLAMAATRRLLDALPTERPYLVLRGGMPEGLDAELIANYLEAPLLGRVASIPGVRSAAEQGTLPSYAGHRTLRRLSSALLAVMDGRER